MTPLIGYRTVAFHTFMTVAAFLGLSLPQETLYHYAGYFALIWGAGGVILRLITTTPAFASTHPDVLNLANAIIAMTPPELPTLSPVAEDPQPVSQPATGAATITAPPTDLVSLAQNVVNALKTIQSVHSQLTSTLLDANDKVSAALPPGVVAPAPQAPVTGAAENPQPQTGTVANA